VLLPHCDDFKIVAGPASYRDEQFDGMGLVIDIDTLLTSSLIPKPTDQ